MGMAPRWKRTHLDGQEWIVVLEDKATLKGLVLTPQATPEDAKRILQRLKANLNSMKKVMAFEVGTRIRMIPIPGGFKVLVENTTENQKRLTWISTKAKRLLRTAVGITNKEEADAFLTEGRQGEYPVS